MTNMVFRERTLINSMLSMAPNIVFAPNIRRTQNTDTGRKTQTQLIIGFVSKGHMKGENKLRHINTQE